MTLQFRRKMQDSQFQQIQKENKLLCDYNLTLEKENQSKNEECGILQPQIDKLHQRLNQSTKNEISTLLNITQSPQYAQLLNKFTTYQSRCFQLQAYSDRILLQNEALKQKIKSNQSPRGTENPYQAQRDSLKSTIRNLEVKVYTLEAQVFSYQSQINDLKLYQRKSRGFNANPQAIEEKVTLLQNQLFRKSEQILKNQALFAIKEQEQKRQIMALNTTIQSLEMKLKQKEQKKVLKQKQGGQDKEIISLKVKNEELVRHLSAKQAEIQALKSQIAEKAKDLSKNEELFIQIKRNQEEISRLRKETTQKISSSIKNQYLLKQISDQQVYISTLKTELAANKSLYMNNEELTLKLAARIQQISRLKSEISELTNVFQKNQELARQLESKQDQVTNLKAQISQKVSIFTPHIINLEKKIAQFQGIIKGKDEEIAEIHASLTVKQEELTKLNKEIITYLNKINLLSQQLSKFEKLQQNRAEMGLKNMENEDLGMLRQKIEQLNAVNKKIDHVNSINVSLNSAISSLEREIALKNVHIKDCQRRINILEEKNRNLQNELRGLIQKMKTNTISATNQSNQSLIFSIRQLKLQVQQLAITNQLLKLENAQLYNQIQEMHRQIAQKNQHRTSKQSRQKSKSPFNKAIEGNYTNTNELTFHPSMRTSVNQAEAFSNKAKTSDKRRTQLISPLNSEIYRNSSSNIKNNENRLSQLQKKIKKLQSENLVLRQHLS